MKINYKNVNTNKLHDELISDGIFPLIVESLNNDTWITYADDTDMLKVNTIVLAHNPTPNEVKPQPTIEEMAEQIVATQIQLNNAQDALDFLIMGGM